MTKYGAVIEIKSNGKKIKETSPLFDNQLMAEGWLGSCVREAKALKIKITDHYLTKFDV